MTFHQDELRPLAILQGLPEDVIDWLCERGERLELAPSEHMFEHGEPAEAMWLVVDGVIQGFEEHGGQWLLVATTERGEVTGMLPFSRMVTYPRYTVAVEHATVLKLDASLFGELLTLSEELGRRLVAQMSDRVRGDVRLEQQSEKLIALGRLSAGLAHELNNPAAAIRRAAVRLGEQRRKMPEVVTALLRHDVSPTAVEELVRLRQRGRDGDGGDTTPVERSDREESMADWLRAHGVEDPWEPAATFVGGGVTVDDLDDVVARLPRGAAGDALVWLAGGIETDGLVSEIETASSRISELVASIKVYSHMDRSTEHKPTDVRVGLDNTLTMFGHELRQKSITVQREYEDDLPLVPANAGELNQVWTNLIDNAIDAVDEGGQLTLRARHNDQWVEVEVVDDGPGIPEELQATIFEPFFTTKDPGIGTGLGLGIANRIVATHQGHVEVRSRPGETVMCVRLPLDPARQEEARDE